jgi:hypothetical protein
MYHARLCTTYCCGIQEEEKTFFYSDAMAPLVFSRASYPLRLKWFAQTVLITLSWQNLYVQRGGQPEWLCMVLTGQSRISALLANVDPCAQQDNADAMVGFAKPSVNNEQALIANAIAYRQHCLQRARHRWPHPVDTVLRARAKQPKS